MSDKDKEERHSHKGVKDRTEQGITDIESKGLYTSLIPANGKAP